MSPIRPCEVKCALKKCSSSSAPGNDKITYFHLKKLPSCHLFLATLYSKILPFLPHLKQSAKLSYILAIERSVDPLIIELRHSILANRSDISSTVLDCLSAAKASVANIHSATFKNHARHNLRSAHIEYWK